MSNTKHPSICEFEENDSKEKNIELMRAQTKKIDGFNGLRNSTKSSILGYKNGLDTNKIDIHEIPEDIEDQESRRNFQRKSITVLNRQFSYFNEDETEEETSLTEKTEEEKKERSFKYHKEDVYFSLYVYIEIMVIHILSFAFVGPFINLYPLIFFKNCYFMKNL